MTTFLKSEEGTVMVFTGTVLPVLLLVALLVLEAGQLYVRQGQLQHLARQAANSGILVFGDILETRAQSNQAALCSVEFPPSVCSSTNRFDFLTRTEVQLLAQSLSTQTAVSEAAQNFARQYDPALELEVEQITVQFPLASEAAVDQDQILVAISDQTNGLTANLFPQDRTIAVQAQSFISYDF